MCYQRLLTMLNSCRKASTTDRQACSSQVLSFSAYSSRPIPPRSLSTVILLAVLLCLAPCCGRGLQKPYVDNATVDDVGNGTAVSAAGATTADGGSWITADAGKATFADQGNKPSSEEKEEEPGDLQVPSKWQPRVTVVEGLPSRLGIASISNPEGTPWCGGAPTFWITGHHCHDTPYCLVNGKWTTPKIAVLNTCIDRHYCVTFDVNKDGVTDLVCTEGAGKGHGFGYTQIHLTQTNGSLKLLPNGHGLQKYPTMRTRVAVTLNNAKGEESFVFIGNEGKARPNGKPNEHRMFRSEVNGRFPYFTEVHGPWVKLFVATCAVCGDLTRDKVDDLVVCDKDGPPLLVRQNWNGSFARVAVPTHRDHLHAWRNVRIADVTRDGIQDLVVVTHGQPSKLFVFRGTLTSPFFDFTTAWYETPLKWASPDVEVLDVNQNGVPDIYVVQADETPGKYYCGAIDRTVILNATTVPPLDKAHDVLLLGTTLAKKFSKTQLSHSLPGCGWIAQRWNDTTMLLGQGSFSYSGYSMLLKW